MADDEDIAGSSGGDRQRNHIPTFNLQFVNISMNATSQEEKQRNQRVVRSAAMKSFRRKQKSQRVQEKAGSPSNRMSHAEKPLSNSKKDRPPDTFRTSPGPSESSSSSEDLAPEAPWPTSNSPILSGFDIDLGIEEALQVGTLSAQSSQGPSAVTTPGINRLGAGRIDPFRIYPVDVTGSNVNELIDHSLSILWPGFRPRSSPNGESKLASAWHQKVRERPIVMHAMLFGAAVHMDVLRSPRMSLHNPVRLFHKVQTMRLLKEELKSPDKTPLDDIILAVLSLGTNEVETMMNHLKEKIQSPFNSPLASVQWLDVYGSIAHIAEHTTAMRSLVARRGGLESIELEGLAEVLSFSDILGATQKLSKPYWPLLKRTLNYPTHHTTAIPRYQLRNLGQGFQGLIAFGINEEAASVFQAMADLTMIIDGHFRGSGIIWDVSSLIDRRNTIQHRLMSLPAGQELPYGEVSSVSVYESVRHAAVIYSVAVTFPLPPLTGIFRKLASLLKSIMEESKFDPCWQLCPKALLWILILGGIAASDTADRTWYVQNLSAVSSALNLVEWEDVVAELGSYLWLECACDPGGRGLWTEVQHDRLLVEVFEGSESGS